MNTFDNFISNVKQNIMRKMIRFTDSEYYLLKFKPDLEADEAKFLELYENIYIMQGISLLSLIPSLFYMVRAYKYKNNLNAFKAGFTQEGHQKISKKGLLYLSFGTVLAINSQFYEYKNDFSRLFKQIGNRERLAMQKGELIPIQ